MKSLNSISPDWDVSDRVVACVTSRAGGESKPPYHSRNFAKHVGDEDALVEKNRKHFVAQFDPELQWQWLQQVHGIETIEITAAGESITADGLLTREVGLVCCVLTADCLPVFFANQEGTEVALVHAGWRGLSAGILENTLAKLVTPAKDLVAWLGPAIGPCHFEVGLEVKELFVSKALSIPEEVALEACFASTENNGKVMADMYALAKLKLGKLGLHNVHGGDRCTFCEEQEFYSFRRDGATGRMLSMIYIKGACAK